MIFREFHTSSIHKSGMSTLQRLPLTEWTTIPEHDEDCTHHSDLVCLWLNAVPITAVGSEHMAPEMIACKFIKRIPLKFKTVKEQIEH